MKVADRHTTGTELSFVPVVDTTAGAAVWTLLRAPIRTLYPGGEDWLARRLDDVLRGKAAAWTAYDGPAPAAVAIETPKANRCRKLSTLYVHPEWRGNGIGSSLLRLLSAQWSDNRVTEITVTCATSVTSDLQPLVVPYGFRRVATLPHRYGNGRHEDVWVRDG